MTFQVHVIVQVPSCQSVSWQWLEDEHVQVYLYILVYAYTVYIYNIYIYW